MKLKDQTPTALLLALAGLVCCAAAFGVDGVGGGLLATAGLCLGLSATPTLLRCYRRARRGPDPTTVTVTYRIADGEPDPTAVTHAPRAARAVTEPWQRPRP